jgi:hypothetical protein
MMNAFSERLRPTCCGAAVGIYFLAAASLLRYDMRVARLIGVRYVVTDASSVPGGTPVYQQMTDDKPLRLFRIDGTNLGRYSPTRLTRS